MSDGPDYFALFQKGQLIPQYHTKEIISWLRFFKGQANYQTYLATYLPKLALDERQQFLADVEGADLAEELSKPANQEVSETTIEVKPDDAPVVTETTTIKVPKKKKTV